MALINCSECGTQMSDKAQSCPKCGAPNPNAAPMQQFAYQPSFNPCARHPQAPAVATCGYCGSAVCKDCKESSLYNYDNKPLCIDCNLAYMSENIANLKSVKRWSGVKFVLLFIILAIAVSVWQSNPDDSNAIVSAWMVAAIGGFFSSMSSMRRSASEKAADDLYTKLNPSDGLMNEGMGCFMRILLALLFAPIYTVTFTVKNLYRWISSRNSLSKAEAEYNDYTAFLRERGDLQ